jgi:hypothetical protein
MEKVQKNPVNSVQHTPSSESFQVYLLPDLGAKEEVCSLLENILLFLVIIGLDVHLLQIYHCRVYHTKYITLQIQKLFFHVFSIKCTSYQKVLQIRGTKSLFYAMYQFIVF